MNGKSKTIRVGDEIRNIGVAAPAKQTFGKRLLQGPLSLAWKLPAAALGAYLLVASPTVQKFMEKFIGSKPAAAETVDFYTLDKTEPAQMGMAYAEVGNAKSAKAIAHKLLKDEGDDYGAAEIFIRLGDKKGIEKCIKLAHKYIEEDGSDSYTTQLLGWLYKSLADITSDPGKKQELEGKALEFLGLAVDKEFSEAQSRKYLAVFCIDVADIYLELGEKKKAREVMERFSSYKGGGKLWGWDEIDLAKAYYKVGMDKEGDELVKKLEKTEGLSKIFEIYSESGEYSKALEILESADGKQISQMDRAVFYADFAESLNMFFVSAKWGPVATGIPKGKMDAEFDKIMREGSAYRADELAKWILKKGLKPDDRELTAEEDKAANLLFEAKDIADVMDDDYNAVLVYSRLGLGEYALKRAERLEKSCYFEEAAGAYAAIGKKKNASADLSMFVSGKNPLLCTFYDGTVLEDDAAGYTELFAKTGNDGRKYAAKIADGLLLAGSPEAAGEIYIMLDDKKGMGDVIDYYEKNVDMRDWLMSAKLRYYYGEAGKKGDEVSWLVLYYAEKHMESCHDEVKQLADSSLAGNAVSKKDATRTLHENADRLLDLAEFYAATGNPDKAGDTLHAAIGLMHILDEGNIKYDLFTDEHFYRFARAFNSIGNPDASQYAYVIGDSHTRFKALSLIGEIEVARKDAEFLQGFKDPEVLTSIAKFYIKSHEAGIGADGDLEKAYDAARKMEANEDYEYAGLAYANLGKKKDALRCISSMQEGLDEEEKGYFDYDIAGIYLALGMKNVAFGYLVSSWKYESGYSDHPEKENCWEKKGWAGLVMGCSDEMSGPVESYEDDVR